MFEGRYTHDLRDHDQRQAELRRNAERLHVERRDSASQAFKSFVAKIFGRGHASAAVEPTPHVVEAAAPGRRKAS